MFVKLKSPKGVIVEVLESQVNNFKSRGFSEIKKKSPKKETK